MKRIHRFALSFLICFAATVGADDAPAPAAADAAVTTAAPSTSSTTQASMPPLPAAMQSSGDPTLDFLLALQQCAPGVYQQKNILSASVGPDWLQQTIIGMNEDGCKVILTTPDSRVMYCNFNSNDMQLMRDQHFLKGMIGDSATAPDQDSVNADLTWTQIKNGSCSFTQQ